MEQPINTQVASNGEKPQASQQLNAILTKPIATTKTPQTTPLMLPTFYIRHELSKIKITMPLSEVGDNLGHRRRLN